MKGTPERGGSAWQSAVAEVPLPPPQPFWLPLLGTVGVVAFPAVAAVAALIALGAPAVPHSSALAVALAEGLSLVEAVAAGLGAGFLAEAAWHRLALPDPGPAGYLPLRWARGRIAHRRAATGTVEALDEDAALRPVTGLGLLGSLIRRGWRRLEGRTGPVAALTATCALVCASWLGIVPAPGRSTTVGATRYGSRIVVRTTPQPPPATKAAPRPSAGAAAARPTPSAARPRAAPPGPVESASPLVRPPEPAGPAPAPASGGDPGPSPGSVVVIVGNASPVAPTPGAGGGTPVPSTPPSPSPPPAQPAFDQIVSANQASGSPQIASPPFATTQGNELVLAFVSAHGPAGSAQAVSAVSGGGLAWSPAAVANTVEGTAEVWQAYAASPVGPSTIAATLSAGGYEGSITVVGFRGAAHAVASSVTGGASSGAPGVKLTTAAAGSLVWAVGHDADRAASIVVIPGQTLVNEFVDTTAAATSWVQATSQIPAAGTQVLVGARAPVNDRWDLAAVEIAPGG